MIPVLDVTSGRAVHAVGGDRPHYADLRSRLHPSTDPLAIAGAFRDTLGLTEPYLADLDAIAGGPPDLTLYRSLIDRGLRPWIDAGIRDEADLDAMADLDGATFVLGLETLAGPAELGVILDRVDPARAILSLDLFDGIPRFAPGSNWPSSDPKALGRFVVSLGVRRLLLLDLARVGRGNGTGTEGLLRTLREGLPEAELAVGGGVATIDDVLALGIAGASAVLIGSALHDGRIDACSLTRLSS